MTITTFQEPVKNKNGCETYITVNVDRNSHPFGRLWTFKAKGETHPWHAKTVAGAYKRFYGKLAKVDAQLWIAAQ